MLTEEDKLLIRAGTRGGRPMHNPEDRRWTMSVRFKASTIKIMDDLINQDRSLSRGGIVRLALDRFLETLETLEVEK